MWPFDLDGKIDMILDGGAAEWGLESTIVDVSVTSPYDPSPRCHHKGNDGAFCG